MSFDTTLESVEWVYRESFVVKLVFCLNQAYRGVFPGGGKSGLQGSISEGGGETRLTWEYFQREEVKPGLQGSISRGGGETRFTGEYFQREEVKPG